VHALIETRQLSELALSCDFEEPLGLECFRAAWVSAASQLAQPAPEQPVSGDAERQRGVLTRCLRHSESIAAIAEISRSNAAVTLQVEDNFAEP
jgi:hypothetical protein